MKDFCKEPPSDLFASMVCDGGTVAATCEFCDREYFDLNGEFMEEGQLDRWQKKMVENPEKYIAHDGTVYFGLMGGRQFVFGCSCNALRRYEDFIWKNRSLICRYLKARGDELVASGQELLNQIPS